MAERVVGTAGKIIVSAKNCAGNKVLKSYRIGEYCELKCVLLKIHMLKPNPQTLRRCLYLEIGPF